MATDALFDPNLPPELAVQQQSLARRQRLAEAMLQRGMTPIQSGNPRSAVSITQGLAQLLNAYRGGQALESVDKDRSALGQQYQSGLADEVQRIAAMRQGHQAAYDPQELEQSADQGNALPENVGGDPRAAVMAALTSQYGPVREMGKLDFQADLKTQENAAARAARLEERALQLDAQAQDKKLDRESRERIAQESNEVKRELAEIKGALSGGGSPYFTFLPTTNGYAVGNARTGEIKAGHVDGQPVIRPQDSPQLQGDIAGAKKKREAEEKRTFNMSGIGGVIKQAKDILNGSTPPTGSGIGNLYDQAAGFFGISPSGSKEAQSLKAVAGALTAKMPRMEGPQSDKDTQLYREMAAEIGNPNVPVDRRKNALQVVENLWAKYEHLNPEAFSGGQKAGDLTPAEQSELDALRKRFGR